MIPETYRPSVACLVRGHRYLGTYDPPYDPFLTCVRCGRELVGDRAPANRDAVDDRYVLVASRLHDRSRVRDRVYDHKPFQGPKRAW